MANEKTIKIEHSCLSDSGGVLNFTAEATGDQTSGGDVDSNTQDVTTTGGQLSVPGSIGTPLDISIVNLDPTNYVEIFRDSGFTYLLSKLKPGRPCHLACLDVIPYAKANTATCKVKVGVNDD